MMAEFESKVYATLVSRTDKLEISLKGDRGIFLFLELEGYNISDVGNPVFPKKRLGLLTAFKNRTRNYSVVK